VKLNTGKTAVPPVRHRSRSILRNPRGRGPDPGTLSRPIDKPKGAVRYAATLAWREKKWTRARARILPNLHEQKETA